MDFYEIVLVMFGVFFQSEAHPTDNINEHVYFTHGKSIFLQKFILTLKLVFV